MAWKTLKFCQDETYYLRLHIDMYVIYTYTYTHVFTFTFNLISINSFIFRKLASQEAASFSNNKQQ